MQKGLEQGHIPEKLWIALQQDTIIPREFEAVLEHAADCRFCAQRLAQTMEYDSAAPKAPAYLAQQIKERAAQLDIRASATLKQTSKRVQLALYSLKISTAVAFSLVMLFAVTNFQNMGLAQMERPETELSQDRHSNEKQGQEREKEKSILDIFNEVSCEATEKLNDFATQLLNGGKRK